MEEKFEPKHLIVKNANISSVNLSGRPTKANPDGGSRSFVLRINDPTEADRLAAEGWNVKLRRPTTLDDGTVLEAYQYIPVSAWFNKYPPDFWLIQLKEDGTATSRKLDVETVGVIDRAKRLNVDLHLVQYHYTKGGGGVTALVREMAVTVGDNAFANSASAFGEDFANIPIVGDDETPF